MKRKLVLIALCILSVLSLIFAACDEQTVEYQSDANGHRPKGSDVAKTVPHIWDSGTVVTPATSSAEGVKEFICVVCGFKRAEAIPQIHNHTYSDWQKSETEHWRVSTCEHAGLEMDRGKHEWIDGDVITKPTFDSAGKKTIICAKCLYVGEEEIPPLERIDIAVALDVGDIDDDGYNQLIWKGAETYAKANNKKIKYYRPANGASSADSSDYNDVIQAAIADGAKAVVAQSISYSYAIEKFAYQNPNVNFVFIDGWVLTDPSGNVLQNVAAIYLNEQQGAFLAGYVAVKEGYRNLGGVFAGGGYNRVINTIAEGFLLGATSAAEEENVVVNVNVSYKYEAYSPSPELYSRVDKWYKNGTEIMFACGGTMYQSVMAAADSNNGKIIGILEQSKLNDCYLTSVIRYFDKAAEWALGKCFSGEWTSIGGKYTVLGVEGDYVGLLTDGFSSASQAYYRTIYNKVKSGAIQIKSSDYDYNLAWVQNLNKTGVININLIKD